MLSVAIVAIGVVAVVVVFVVCCCCRCRRLRPYLRHRRGFVVVAVLVSSIPRFRVSSLVRFLLFLVSSLPPLLFSGFHRLSCFSADFHRFPSFARFLVCLIPRSFVFSFPWFFASSFSRFLDSSFHRFLVVSLRRLSSCSRFLVFLVSRFLDSSILRFLASSFPRFFVSSMPRFVVFLVSSLPRVLFSYDFIEFQCFFIDVHTFS